MNLRWLGMALMWIGFLAGSYFAVCNTEFKPNPWMTVPWLYYGLSVLVCIAGVVMIRSQKPSDAEHLSDTENRIDILWDRLNQLQVLVGNLAKTAAKLPPNEISDEIDDKCSPLYAEFADNRNGLTQRFGLDVFADIMTDFASAERYTNRAWSAAADGYRDEAVNSLEIAHVYLQQAIEKFTVQNKQFKTGEMV